MCIRVHQWVLRSRFRLESHPSWTITLDLLATMAPRALRTENLTAPVLFRLVAQHRPTLLLDEVDTYLTLARQ